MAADSQTSELAKWLIEVLFERWKLQRQQHLEPKWNRHRAAYLRDANLDESKTWKKQERTSSWKSDTMAGMTKQKVTTGAAIVTDMMFKGGRVAFMLVEDDIGAAVRADPTAQAPGGAGAAAAARSRDIELSENLIHRQFENCDAIEQIRRAAHQAALYGRLWMKRYVTSLADEDYRQVAPGVFTTVQGSGDSLAVEFKNIWNMFWDLETDDFLRSDGCDERDYVSCQDLRDFLDKPHYIRWAIRDVITKRDSEQSPSNPNAAAQNPSDAPRTRELSQRSKDIERHEFWCRAPRQKVEAHERDMYQRYLQEVDAGEMTITELQELFPDGPPDPAKLDDLDRNALVEVMVVVADGTIIRFARTTPADRPYFTTVWEDSPDSVGGAIGVADNVEPEQKVLTGAVRTLENNVKLIGNVILAIKRKYIEGDVKDVSEGQMFDLTDDCDDARKAIQQIEIADVTGSILKLIELFMGAGDLSSMIPRVEQGAQSENEQTAFELQQRLEQSGKYMAAVLGNFDRLVEGVVRSFYRYNMGNPALTVGKGNYKVKALGFSSFENRVIRLNKLLQVLDRLLNSEDLKAISKIKWVWAEILKALDLDPDQVIKTQEELDLEAQENEQRMQTLAASGAGAGIQSAQLQKLIAEQTRIQAEARDKEAAATLKDVQAQAAEDERVRKNAEAVAKLRGAGKPAGPAAPSQSSGTAQPQQQNEVAA